MVIKYCKNENEQNMLLNLYKKKWNDGLKNMKSTESKKKINDNLEEMVRLSKDYSSWIKKENDSTIKQFSVSSIGKLDPKRHLREVII
jgi:26S proteasome regulatory subunit N11